MSMLMHRVGNFLGVSNKLVIATKPSGLYVPAAKEWGFDPSPFPVHQPCPTLHVNCTRVLQLQHLHPVGASSQPRAHLL